MDSSASSNFEDTLLENDSPFGVFPIVELEREQECAICREITIHYYIDRPLALSKLDMFSHEP